MDHLPKLLSTEMTFNRGRRIYHGTQEVPMLLALLRPRAASKRTPLSETEGRRVIEIHNASQ